MVGGALQAATQSASFIVVARVVTGLGTGALTAIIPVYVAETSTSHHRGKFLGLVFIANYLGIAVAYWLSYGLSFLNGPYGKKWFISSPLAVLAGLPMFPRHSTRVWHQDAPRLPTISYLSRPA